MQKALSKLASRKQSFPVGIEEAFLDGFNAMVADDHKAKRYRPTAVAIVRNGDGNVLLIQSKKSGQWSYPQGGIDEGEDIISALARELEEETGLVPSEVCRSCYVDRHDIPKWSRDGFTKGKHYYYFLVRVKGIPRVRIQRTEVSDSQWDSPSDTKKVISALGNKYRDKRESMLIALDNALSY